MFYSLCIVVSGYMKGRNTWNAGSHFRSAPFLLAGVVYKVSSPKSLWCEPKLVHGCKNVFAVQIFHKLCTPAIVVFLCGNLNADGIPLMHWCWKWETFHPGVSTILICNYILSQEIEPFVCVLLQVKTYCKVHILAWIEMNHTANYLQQLIHWMFFVVQERFFEIIMSMKGFHSIISIPNTTPGISIVSKFSRNKRKSSPT